jgi:hypothetical protein
MHIEELKGGEVVGEGGEEGRWSFVGSDTKRVLVGAGARALFYPTLVYNVVRNRLQAEFRWWDKIDEVWFHMFELYHVYLGDFDCYAITFVLCCFLIKWMHDCYMLLSRAI